MPAIHGKDLYSSLFNISFVGVYRDMNRSAILALVLFLVFTIQTISIADSRDNIYDIVIECTERIDLLRNIGVDVDKYVSEINNILYDLDNGEKDLAYVRLENLLSELNNASSHYSQAIILYQIRSVVYITLLIMLPLILHLLIPRIYLLIWFYVRRGCIVEYNGAEKRLQDLIRDYIAKGSGRYSAYLRIYEQVSSGRYRLVCCERGFIHRLFIHRLWLITLLISIIVYILSIMYDIDILKLLIGIPIAFYIPGRLIVELMPLNTRHELLIHVLSITLSVSITTLTVYIATVLPWMSIEYITYIYLAIIVALAFTLDLRIEYT